MGMLKQCYLGWIQVLKFVQPVFLLAVRVLVGWSFMMHGWGKLTDIDGTAKQFAGMNIPQPTLNAYLAGTAEFGGGALLILGFASRISTIPLLISMIVAYATAHKCSFDKAIETVSDLSKAFTDASAWSKAFTDAGAFVEAFLAQPPTPYVIVVVVVLLFGPGVLSLDGLLKHTVFRAKAPPAPAGPTP